MKAEYDQLTGLLSRRLIQESLEEYLQCSIVLFDIDKFQIFNACYGHPEGDQALIAIAKIILQTVPTNSNVFRSDGDEFTVMMEQLPENEVVQLALQIRKTIEKQFSHFTAGQWFQLLEDSPKVRIQSIPFTLSCGIAFYPKHGRTFQQLRDVIYNSALNPQEDTIIAVAQA
jgi:diguanylate cyclase (GGDEF)-like protein